MSQQRYQKTFVFEFPLVDKVVRNLKIVNETIGVLIIEGSCFQNQNVPATAPLDEQYNVDIDFCKWNSTDIKPVLEYTGMMEDIYRAAYQRVVRIYKEEPLSHNGMMQIFANNLKSA
jgi:hypothetical protein